MRFLLLFFTSIDWPSDEELVVAHKLADMDLQRAIARI